LFTLKAHKIINIIKHEKIWFN